MIPSSASPRFIYIDIRPIGSAFDRAEALFDRIEYGACPAKVYGLPHAHDAIRASALLHVVYVNRAVRQVLHNHP